MTMKYIDAWSQEIQSLTTPGNYFGIKVQLAILRDITDADKSIIRKHVDKIVEELEVLTALADPELPRNKELVRQEIIGLFPEGKALYVEEIPNGYCNRPCCFDRPWFIVTTPKGRITVGWRKRVINIDWEKSLVTRSYKEMFPDEDVTKGNYFIHAWGHAKAKEYLQILLQDVDNA